MSRQESITTLYGEMMDLIACKQIAEGKANLKKSLSFDQIMHLR